MRKYRNGLDNLYKDKLDEIITKEKYDALFREFSAEKEQITQSSRSLIF